MLWLQTLGVVIAALFLGGTFMGLTALGLIGARETGEGDPRGRIALMTASFSLGQIIGPAFAGFAYDATGSLAMPSLIAAAGLVVAALLSIVADGQRRRSALGPARHIGAMVWPPRRSSLSSSLMPGS